jgi:CHAT domain-containing protein
MGSRRLLALFVIVPCLCALDTKLLLEQVRQAPTPAAKLALLTAALPQAQDRKQQALVEYNIARHYQNQDNSAAAVEWFAKAYASHQQLGDRFQQAIVLNNWAIAETELGENTAAKARLETALAIRREIKDGPGIAYTMLGLANVYAAWGDLAAAHQVYESVAAQWRQLKNIVGEAHALNNDGLILAALGDPVRAAAAHRQALALFREAKETRFEAYALSNLGLVEPKEAEGNFRRAIAMLPTPVDKAYPQQNLADVLLRSGRLAEAESLYRASLAAKLEAKDRAGAASTHSRLAAFHLRRNALAEGEAEIRRALELYAAVGDRAGEASALATLAAIEWQFTKRSQSLQTIARARSIVEETRSRVLSPDLRSSYFATKRSIYDFEISKLLLTKRSQEALAISERARARLLLDELDEQETPANARERQLRQELSAQEQRLPGSRERVEALLREWRTAQAALRKEWAAEPSGAAALRALASAETTLVQYWLSEEEGAAFVITPGGVRAVPLPGRRALAPRIDAFLAALTARVTLVANETAAGRQARLAAAEAAWKAMLPEMQKLLPVAARRLVVAPEGPLARLPWQLLAPGEVTLAPSLSVLAALRQRPPSPHRKVSVVALPSLRFAEREAEAIAALTPVNRVVDVDAALRSSRILHLATHTTVDDREPALSGIALPERTMRLYELYGKSIRADLVVLSSCRSAAGPEISGEGVIGLARGFLHAGARRVVASLWSVDDQATARLMEHFYTEMFKTKKSPAAALFAAQQRLRAEPRWSHPVYWAGFVLQGDWR